MKYKDFGIIAVAAGAALFFFGSNLANIGETVDSLIQSKWFAGGLFVVGLLLLGSSTKAFARI